MSMVRMNASTWSSDYELPVPFEVVLPNGKNVICEEVVRAMPGRRYVCRGRVGEQAIFIKLFSMSHRASREWHDEQTGIEALHTAGIAAPTILYAGVIKDAETQVVVYAALPDAESARQCWEQGGEAMRLEVLNDLVELIAQHHAAGLRQVDLHLLNFIYSDATLYTLDASDINTSANPLSRSDSMDGLADLLALLPVEYDEVAGDIYVNYWQHRSQPENNAERSALLQHVIDKRAYKLRKYLKKVFRSCSAFVANKTWREFTVYDRSCESESLRTLLVDPDHAPSMGQAKILKDGNTCTVTALELDAKPLVCKRYNIKNILHALSRAFRPSRAACSWKNSHHLLRCGIATARPVAMREQRLGPMRGRGWLFMERIHGDNLYYYHDHPERLASDTFKKIAQAVSQLFEKMVQERISHGDMKAGNFIYHDDKLYLIDLDSMQAHTHKKSFEEAFTRDMSRFFKNWQNHPATIALFHEALSQTIVGPYLPIDANRE